MMKKLYGMILVVLFLCGCSGNNQEFDRAMRLRTSLLNAEGCNFETTITASFSDQTYTFSMNCRTDREGNIGFSVTNPEYIAGIGGTIGVEGGKLTFDDAVLAFALQTDGILSPVSAPWVLMQAMRSGYVRYCVQEDDLLRVTVDDSYQDDALTLDIWINSDGQPIQADIFENNRRILTMTIRNYTLL